MVPKTVCELKEIDTCEDIAKEVPSLTIANECRFIPIEKCSDDDVPAIEVINPVVKKVLTTRARNQLLMTLEKLSLFRKS